LDYCATTVIRIAVFKEELIAAALHPRRIMKWLEGGMDIMDI
jgi:hypothetical protein